LQRDGTAGDRRHQATGDRRVPRKSFEEAVVYR
jgi:hypothetical protein